MKRLLILFGLCLVALGTFASPTHAQRPPLVLAFYYNWFDENTWTPSRVPDMPAVKYVSRDPGAMARHIQQAKSAGIDAFVVSWWGAGNPTDDNFKVLLDQARAANFRVAVDFELTSPFYHSKDDAVRSLRNLLANHAQHPAYLRAEGKPVVFFWREQKYSVDEWRAIRDAVDPQRQSLWIAEGVKDALPYLNVFDGFHLYSIAWAQNVAAELQKWPPRVKAYGADKIWVATVMPGNNDTLTGRPDAYIRDRRGGAFYRETWRGAFSTYPDWIIITSWNEWVEGTMIEPSVSYGNLYLDITREFAARFKAGLPTPTPTFTRTPTPTRTPTHTPTATPFPSPSPEWLGDWDGSGIRARVTSPARVRSEPSPDAPVLGQLREGASVTLIARTIDSKWWQIPLATARARGWIVADFAQPEGDTEALPIIEASIVVMPTPTDEATATPTPTAAPTRTPTLAPLPTPTPTPPPTRAPAWSFLKSIFPFLP